MVVIEKILNLPGLNMSDINSLNQTDSLIIWRIVDEVQNYAAYHDKNPELEHQCEDFKKIIRQHLNKSVIK